MNGKLSESLETLTVYVASLEAWLKQLCREFELLRDALQRLNCNVREQDRGDRG